MRSGLLDNGQIAQPAFLANLSRYGLTQEMVWEFAHEENDLAGFVERLFKVPLDARGKHIWGEKTGSNAYCYSQIKKLYPKAAFIHIVRNPLDAIASVVRRRNSVFRAACHWLYNNMACDIVSQGGACIRITYEELVTNPAGVVRSVCQSIGVEFESEMLERKATSWDEHDSANIHGSWRQRPSEAISTASIGAYARTLNSADVEMISRLRYRGMDGVSVSLCDVARSYGYELSATRTRSMWRYRAMKCADSAWHIAKHARFAGKVRLEPINRFFFA